MPVHQVLVYPVTQQVSDSTPSYETYADAVPLNRPLTLWFLERYLPNTDAASNPLRLAAAGRRPERPAQRHGDHRRD